MKMCQRTKTILLVLIIYVGAVVTEHLETQNFDFLSKHSPKQLRSIVSLKISNASISKVDPKLKYLKNLEYLDLSYNNIQPSSIPSLASLKTLKLNANNLKSINLTLLPPNIEDLDLSNNFLYQIPKDWRTLRSLKSLRLHKNPMDCECLNVMNYKNIIKSGIVIPETMSCHSPSKYIGKDIGAINCSLGDIEVYDEPIEGSGSSNSFEDLTSENIDNAQLVDDGHEPDENDNYNDVSSVKPQDIFTDMPLPDQNLTTEYQLESEINNNNLQSLPSGEDSSYNERISPESDVTTEASLSQEKLGEYTSEENDSGVTAGAPVLTVPPTEFLPVENSNFETTTESSVPDTSEVEPQTEIVTEAPEQNIPAEPETENSTDIITPSEDIANVTNEPVISIDSSEDSSMNPMAEEELIVETTEHTTQNVFEIDHDENNSSAIANEKNTDVENEEYDNEYNTTDIIEGIIGGGTNATENEENEEEGSGIEIEPDIYFPQPESGVYGCIENCSTPGPAGENDEEYASLPPNYVDQINIIFEDFNPLYKKRVTTIKTTSTTDTTTTEEPVTESSPVAITETPFVKVPRIYKESNSPPEIIKENVVASATSPEEISKASTGSDQSTYIYAIGGVLIFVAIFAAVYLLKRQSCKPNNGGGEIPNDDEEMKPLGKPILQTVNEKHTNIPESVPLMNGKDEDHQQNGSSNKKLYIPLKHPEKENVEEDNIPDLEPVSNGPVFDDVDIRPKKNPDSLTPQRERVTIKESEIPDSIPKTPLLVHRQKNSDGDIITVVP